MKLLRLFRAALPHAVIVLSGVFLVFLILDQYNPTMNFTGNPVSAVLLAVFCVLSIINAVLSSAAARRETRLRAVPLPPRENGQEESGRRLC